MRDEPQPAPLSPRERQLVVLWLQGLSPERIAARIGRDRRRVLNVLSGARRTCGLKSDLREDCREILTAALRLAERRTGPPRNSKAGEKERWERIWKEMFEDPDYYRGTAKVRVRSSLADF